MDKQPTLWEKLVLGGLFIVFRTVSGIAGIGLIAVTELRQTLNIRSP